MEYIVIGPKNSGKIKSIPLNRRAKSILQKGNHYVIAKCESKEKAEGVVMGIGAHCVVEKFASHLPSEVKVAFKSEIAQLATKMYNTIIE